MTDSIGQHLLRDACRAAQKLHKKLRQLRNRGDAADADVADAAATVAALRRVMDRHGLTEGYDLDSRPERTRRREEGT
jgi:hypothetical protein